MAQAEINQKLQNDNIDEIERKKRAQKRLSFMLILIDIILIAVVIYEIYIVISSTNAIS